jgi:hypothetical protein
MFTSCAMVLNDPTSLFECIVHTLLLIFILWTHILMVYTYIVGHYTESDTYFYGIQRNTCSDHFHTRISVLCKKMILCGFESGNLFKFCFHWVHLVQNGTGTVL